MIVLLVVPLCLLVWAGSSRATYFGDANTELSWSCPKDAASSPAKGCGGAGTFSIRGSDTTTFGSNYRGGLASGVDETGDGRCGRRGT